MKTLTKSEMLLMNILWGMQRGARVADIQKQYPEPQPAYTTIATFLKILEQKGFVEKRKSGVGKTFVYSPLMTQERYRRLVMDEVKQTFFDGSLTSLVSFFAKEEKLTDADIREIVSIIEKNNHNQHLSTPNY